MWGVAGCSATLNCCCVAGTIAATADCCCCCIKVASVTVAAGSGEATASHELLLTKCCCCSGTLGPTFCRCWMEVLLLAVGGGVGNMMGVGTLGRARASGISCPCGALMAPGGMAELLVKGTMPLRAGTPDCCSSAVLGCCCSWCSSALGTCCCTMRC